jgi:2'-5' RNA ligase
MKRRTRIIKAEPSDSARQGSLWRERRSQHVRDPPRPPQAVFFALQPDPDVARHLGGLARHFCSKHKSKGRPRPKRCLHVTLHAVGRFVELPRDVLTTINAAVSLIKMPPFTVAFDRTMNFGCGRDRMLVLVGDDGVAGVRFLQHELVAALQKIGLAGCREPRFTPHLTLLYHRGEIADQIVEDICWTVRDFVLLRSYYGQSRHEELARWPLG